MADTEASQPIEQTIDRLLVERFGFETFRAGQRAAMLALLERRRLLCIQPTGHGKSLLYQLPSLLLSGMTLVISPLLALVRDQLGHLDQRFGIPAAAINSDQTPEENDAAVERALAGELKILFIAPEQLDNLDTAEVVSRLPISLLVVDEAHCISTWGHDFRPSYRQIVKVLERLAAENAELHVLGLTATADQRAEDDIARQLADTQASGGRLNVAREAMDRPNIALGVAATTGLPQKLALLDRLLRDVDGSGILYCATRDQTEIVARYLRERGHDVLSYHAGYAPEKKRALQQAFIGGEHRAIAATNALGMGIDKPDIRFIVHVDVPGSITAYYQEVGRAGRDGLPARGILLFDPADRRVQEHFIRSAQPTPDDFEAILQCIRPDDGAGDGQWPNQRRIKSRSGLHPTRVTVVLAELMEQGFIEKVKQSGRQVYRRIEDRQGAPDLERYARQRQVRDKELEAMLRYGERGVDCLMQSLRLALGDPEAERCGRCSLCRADDWEQLAVDGTLDTAATARWLEHRDILIPESRAPKYSEGLALLDSEDRAPLFVQFMRQRAKADCDRLPDRVLELLDAKLAGLRERHEFGAAIAMPSRSWSQRDDTLSRVAAGLGCEAIDPLLVWDDPPETRQGERLNNDQRRENVAGKMGLAGSVAEVSLAERTGAILLLDDYVGSAQTLKEAVRCLRKQGGFEGPIVPLTIAKVRWRLGRRGMV